VRPILSYKYPTTQPTTKIGKSFLLRHNLLLIRSRGTFFFSPYLWFCYPVRYGKSVA
jgi:hypothetical protein